MEEGIRTQQSPNDRLVFLKKEQEQYAEGSKKWLYLQENINQIVAQNFLEYVNR